MKHLVLILSISLGGCMATAEPITPRSSAVYVASSYSAPPVRIATSIAYPSYGTRHWYASRRHVPYWGNTPSQRRQRRWPSYVCSNYDADCSKTSTLHRGPWMTYRNKPIVVIKRKKPKIHGIIKNKHPHPETKQNNPNSRKNHKKRKHKKKGKRNKKR